MFAGMAPRQPAPPAPCRLAPTQGKLLAVTELGSDPTEPGAVHFGFQPSEGADAADKLTHLEIIRQVQGSCCKGG